MDMDEEVESVQTEISCLRKKRSAEEEAHLAKLEKLNPRPDSNADDEPQQKRRRPCNAECDELNEQIREMETLMEEVMTNRADVALLLHTSMSRLLQRKVKWYKKCNDYVFLMLKEMFVHRDKCVQYLKDLCSEIESHKPEDLSEDAAAFARVYPDRETLKGALAKNNLLSALHLLCKDPYSLFRDETLGEQGNDEVKRINFFVLFMKVLQRDLEENEQLFVLSPRTIRELSKARSHFWIMLCDAEDAAEENDDAEGESEGEEEEGEEEGEEAGKVQSSV